MKELVLRSDVVTLKETTEKLQRDLGIDIHEAADIVLSVLDEHGSSIQFWTVPSRGLPYKDDQPSQQRRYGSEWLESRWWDEECQQRQDELRKLTGVKSYQDDNKIEEMTLLRKDAYRLFLSDALDMAADRCTAEPKSKLVQITKLLSSIANLSDGRAKTSELGRAFCDMYDADRTMIYRSGNWLCEPINGGIAGHTKRSDISCEFVNSYGRPELDEYLILKTNAVTIAQQLWMKFFDESLNSAEIELVIDGAVCEGEFSNKATTNAVAASTLETEPPLLVEHNIDPSDLPIELDAANMAYRAVLNGYGEKSETFKNRLIDYLEQHFTDLKAEAVQRIATVANPDKSTGRKKSNKE